ncbi:uncharacterized protein LOC122860657, partial [Aphidius gifuensis]|uniref:uncharacterized protein LOC122860657 n=1 Tax=Aphidius gifuensis TaxID=684658 RepID=UPI001CDD0A14
MARYRLQNTKSRFKKKKITATTSQSETQLNNLSLCQQQIHQHRYPTRSRKLNKSHSMTECSDDKQINNHDTDDDDDDNSSNMMSPEATNTPRHMKRTSSDSSIICLGEFRKIPQFIDLVNNKEEPQK